MQRIGQVAKTSLQTRVDAHTVLKSELLQFNHLELSAALDAELTENPALERLDDGPVITSDEEIIRSIAPDELRPSSEDFQFLKSIPDAISASERGSDSWQELQRAEESLVDHLMAQMGSKVAPEELSIAEYLIGSLDERGYLLASIEDVANDCHCSIDQAAGVLSALQSCDPPGIGATTVRECLMRQLNPSTSFEQELALLILDEHFDEFVARRAETISRSCRVLPSVVMRAFDEIMGLNPFPAESFEHGTAQRVRSVTHSAVCELVIERTEQGWSVSVQGVDGSSLCISHTYRARLDALKQMSHPPQDEQQHVATYVSRAERFIDAVRMRQETMYRIGKYLVEKQASFLSTGNFKFLQPLLKNQVAKGTGLHESTISRATKDKFLQIATGEVVPFDVFFKPAIRIQKMIEEILATENPNNRLSDERIVHLLAERGVDVARRTVAKYRDRTKLLSSRQRRSA